MAVRLDVKHVLENITDSTTMDDFLKRQSHNNILTIWLSLPFVSEEAHDRWVESYKRVFNGGDKDG